MAIGFEKLDVYRLAEKIADLVWKIVLRWKGVPRDTVGKQMIRSADSIGANIAEGIGRGTYQENRRFVKIARGSLYETRHWLRRSFTRSLLSKAEVDQLQPLVKELSPRLNAYLKSIGPKKTDNHQ
jgi:four helix bundle protein